MKQSAILLSLAVAGLTACQPGTRDDANDAGGTASPYLARQVVGVRMLSNDAIYDKASNLLAEDFVRGTFELGGDTDIEVIDEPEGGKFVWGKNEVEVAFASQRPYPSIYHADYAFDRMFQNKKAAKIVGDADPDMAEKGALTGPAPEGTGSETPRITGEEPTIKRAAPAAAGAKEGAGESTGAESPAGASAGTGNDASASNDTTTSVSRETPAAAHLTKPAVSTGNFTAYPGLGDKAVWDASTKTMHVLLNNHILNVRVNTSDNVTVSRQRAAILANVILDEVIGTH